MTEVEYFKSASKGLSNISEDNHVVIKTHLANIYLDLFNRRNGVKKASVFSTFGKLLKKYDKDIILHAIEFFYFDGEEFWSSKKLYDYFNIICTRFTNEQNQLNLKVPNLMDYANELRGSNG